MPERRSPRPEPPDAVRPARGRRHALCDHIAHSGDTMLTVIVSSGLGFAAGVGTMLVIRAIRDLLERFERAEYE